MLYTDGVTEIVNGKNVQYGNKRLEDFLINNRNLETGDFNQKLLKEIDRYASGKFKDDIFLLDIKIKGVEKTV